jgi:hypothetical protein
MLINDKFNESDDEAFLRNNATIYILVSES